MPSRRSQRILIASARQMTLDFAVPEAFRVAAARGGGGLPQPSSAATRAMLQVRHHQVMSQGSSWRPSGVNICPAWNPKPVQGPVRSMRSLGPILLMLQSHPCQGSQQGGKSQARAGALPSGAREPDQARYRISHNVYYVQSIPEDAGVPLASITGLAMPSQEASLPSVPIAAWQLRLPPSSDQGLVHDPGDPAAGQTDPRDNDLFLFKGGSIQSLIGHESQRSQ